VEEPKDREDLDELIGEIRREAARRRASPTFPLDAEAAIDAEMDRLGPIGASADLPAVVAQLRARAQEPTDEAEGPGAQEGQARVPGVPEVAGLVASALTALTARVERLERRVPRPPQPGAAAPIDGRASDPLARTDEVADHLQAAFGSFGSGVVLVGGRGSADWIEGLVAAGLDAYAVDPLRPDYAEDGRVRAGGLLDHLRTVGDGGLAAVVVVGELTGAEVAGLADLAGELARSAPLLAVWSEAPWAWRRRRGETVADLAASRPLSPETWMETLASAGWKAVGGYGDQGTDYLLLASANP
jgi:hypothetical protein